MLDAFAQRGLGEHDLEALISQLLTIEFAHRRGELGGYMLTPAEIKRALSLGARSTRATAAWLLWRATGRRGRRAGNKVRRGGRPSVKYSRDIWTLDTRDTAGTGGRSSFVLMTVECEDAFEDAVDAVIDFIVPYRLYLMADSLRLQKEHDARREHPRAALRLANALIDPAIHPLPSDLADFLQLCVDADPSVTAEATYIRLFGLRRLQGS